jgi:CBS domain-containing protein
MRIASILHQKGSNVVMVSPEATLRQAVHTLNEHRIGALVVSGDGQRIDGIMSERDVSRALADHGGRALDLRVQAVMTDQVHTCSDSDTVDQLMATMTERRVRHVPVVSNEVVIGIVSIGDVVKSRLDELEAEARTLHDYIELGR